MDREKTIDFIMQNYRRENDNIEDLELLENYLTRTTDEELTEEFYEVYYELMTPLYILDDDVHDGHIEGFQ